MQILVDSEIEVNYSDGEGWNALQFLCRYYPHDNLIEIITILRERGIGTKLKLENGWSALQSANLMSILSPPKFNRYYPNFNFRRH